jgi:hypothetical protein
MSTFKRKRSQILEAKLTEKNDRALNTRCPSSTWTNHDWYYLIWPNWHVSFVQDLVLAASRGFGKSLLLSPPSLKFGIIPAILIRISLSYVPHISDSQSEMTKRLIVYLATVTSPGVISISHWQNLVILKGKVHHLQPKHGSDRDTAFDLYADPRNRGPYDTVS